MKTSCLLLIACFWAMTNVQAQLLDEKQLEDTKQFRLSEALAHNNPNEVFSIKIEGGDDSLMNQIGKFKNLQKLYFSRSYMEVIPESVKQCAQLQVFGMRGEEINELPAFFGDFKHLRSISIAYPSIYDGRKIIFPTSITKIKSLQSVVLIDCPIDTIPESLTRCTSLRELNLYANKINHIPASLGNLVNLEILNLGANKLKDVPMESWKVLGKLKALKNLNLTNNSIPELTPAIGQLTELEILELYNNNLTTLPQEIGKLTKLKQLILGESRGATNDITDLPESIANLQLLEKLDISKCKLTKFPIGIFELKNLRFLAASHNQITEIPEEIGQLKKLERLHVHYNQLKEVPASIAQLDSLEHFVRYSNPWPTGYQQKLIFLMAGVPEPSTNPEVIANAPTIISVSYNFYDAAVMEPENYAIALTEGSLKTQTNDEDWSEARQIPAEQWEAIQQMAYWMAEKRYQWQKKSLADGGCMGGTSFELIIDDDKGRSWYIDASSCGGYEYDEELALLLGLLQRLRYYVADE